MVATADCKEKAKQPAGNKVSKPLMEKKRRARINQCLDELKSLLESFYSSSIRKRKLEKADILELTVKHLRSLQKIQSCTAAASEYPEYQMGFRSCLANVNHYLLMADNLSGSDRCTASLLPSRACRSRRRGGVSSTMDSGQEQPEAPEEARELLMSASGSKEGRRFRSEAHTLPAKPTTLFLTTEDSRRSPDRKHAVVSVQKTPGGENSLQRNFECVSHGNEAVNTERCSVWRPW